MWKDPIVEEVRKIRRELAEQNGGTISAIIRAARRRQATGGRKVVSLSSRGIRVKKTDAIS